MHRARAEHFLAAIAAIWLAGDAHTARGLAALAAAEEKPLAMLRVAEDEAKVLAQADFATAVLPLPAGFHAEVVCCVETSLLGDPITVPVELVLPADSDPLAAAPPTITLDSYSVDARPPRRILRRPNYTAVRREVVETARTAAAIYLAAHRKLVELARYQTWRQQGLRYRTSLLPSVSKAGSRTWNVYFHADGSNHASDTINMIVELAQPAVIDITAGPHRERIPI